MATDRPSRAPAGEEPGPRIQMLRKRCGWSIRKLAELSGVTAGMISCIERGANSPSIATLQRILAALDTDLASFFGAEPAAQEGPVYQREGMRLISDDQRSYTIVFPRQPGIQVEMLDEHISPGEPLPPLERLSCDVAGYMLSGALVLEVAGQPKRTLRPGDAFYIAKDTAHRGYATGDEPARLLTVYSPPRY